MRSLQASVMTFGLSSTAAIGARAHDVQDGGGDATSDEEGCERDAAGVALLGDPVGHAAAQSGRQLWDENCVQIFGRLHSSNGHSTYVIYYYEFTVEYWYSVNDAIKYSTSTNEVQVSTEVSVYERLSVCQLGHHLPPQGPEHDDDALIPRDEVEVMIADE
ncbi:hypothetical protein B0H10DRAFT_2320460 [Mycena sp. CBHHK59/15]|nr:hypothetical protein B0H10DRAFT_2320460 [Mycena sp. CBHHK59/15]